MTDRIRDMRNLGAVMETMLTEVDITTPAELKQAGALDAFRRLKFRFGTRVSLNALYAMEASLLDCDWRSLDADTKARLQDALANKE